MGLIVPVPEFSHLSFIIDLFIVILFSDFKLSLIHLLSVIIVFLIICVSL